VKKTIWRVLVLVLVLSLAAVGVVGCSGGDQDADVDKPKIIVSSKTFTEALLLGSITHQYLEHLGYPVENKTGLGELAVIRPALESGEINCYWEYTGTVLINIMEEEPSFDEEQCFNDVKKWDEKNGIIWLDYAPLNNTYAIMATKKVADRYNLKTTTDAVEAVKDGVQLRFITAQEWVERPDGLQHWQSVYDFTYPKKLHTQAALNMGYEALKADQADLGLAFTTDPRVKAYGLVALEDDKSAFPVYNPAPLFREEIIKAYPEITEQMKKLSSLLNDETIIDLNEQVDIGKKSVEEVAKNFLKENGLID